MTPPSHQQLVDAKNSVEVRGFSFMQSPHIIIVSIKAGHGGKLMSALGGAFAIDGGLSAYAKDAYR